MSGREDHAALSGSPAVTARTPKNIAASVRQRLLNKARATQRPFSEVLQYFAMERFLYRLSRSPYADRFVLKGALLLNTWKAPFSRSTMDIDLMLHSPHAQKPDKYRTSTGQVENPGFLQGSTIGQRDNDFYGAEAS